ncbi:hypothetical protein [Marinobacter sp.]|uniref:hypothetical protein n=2 Tax=unclassified Marinobacter TaxID=83889 RepID=UPI002B27550F|nr:hypothetical protein [Marinobacter sp.]
MKSALPDLVAHFRYRHGFFRREEVHARLYELDSFGCVMKTDKPFEPGDTVTLDLVMKMPLDDIWAKGISGLVTEKRKHCSNFFYSIDFIQPDSNENSPLSEKLRRIREVLYKKQTLRSRRAAGPTTWSRQTA